MVLAILLVFFASFLGGITNHIDKYMITGIDEGKNNIKVLMIFSSFIAGIVLAPFWLIFSHFNIHISLISFISVFFSASFYIIAIVFYFKAMEDNDASIVVVMSQMIPVFSYIMALFLFKEKLTTYQMIGSIIILLSAILISFDFKEKNHRNKFKALFLMTLSSCLAAMYYILFDVSIRNSSYYACVFWFQISLLIIGLALLFIKSFRVPFLKAIKKNGKRYFILNTINEALNLISHFFVNCANLLIPIALVNVINGFQGAFVFLLGFLGTIFFPKYLKEDLSGPVVIQKVSSILLGIIGLIILVYC